MMPADPERLTKQEAAARLDVSERTIDQYVKAGKLDPRKWRPQGRGQWRTGFLVEDVQKLVAEAAGGPATPFLVREPADPANGNGHHHAAIAKRAATAEPSGEAIVRAVFALLRQMVTAEGPQEAPQDPKGPQGSETPWIDIPTAATILGRSRAYVRRQIKAGVLHAERDRCVLVRRKDLEAL